MASPEKKARYNVIGQVKDAMERGDRAEVARILSECSRRDSDSIMTQLVSRDQWDAVKQVIRCVGDEERTWNIGGVLVEKNILLSVAEGNWRGIDEMPHERFLHSTLEWILKQACTRAQQTDIVQYVLPHCEDDQLDSAIQQLVTHGLWFAAGRMLQRPVSDERVRWVIQQACDRAEELSLRSYVIPCCPNNTLDFLLTELVSRDMWLAAGRVLMRGVSDITHRWVLKEACCRAQHWQLKHKVWPYCALHHINSVTKALVSEGQWRSVNTLLKCTKGQSLTVILDGLNVDQHSLHLAANKNWEDILKLQRICASDSEKVWSFCESNSKETLPSCYLFYHHRDFHLKNVPFNTTDSKWIYGIKGFPPHVTDLNNLIAVLMFSNSKQNQESIRVVIIPRCNGKHLDSIFTQCFDKYYRENDNNTSAHSSSKSKYMWTVTGLCANSTNAQITNVSEMSCSDPQLYSVLRQMFTQHVWWALGKVLEQGLDDNSVTQILKKTQLYDDDKMIVEHVLPHCTDSQTDLAVTELVFAGQWKSVTKLVQLVGDRKQTWTVGGTSVDTTLLHLVAGGRWGEVGDMLQQGVDDAQLRWAADIAMLHADDSVFAEHILRLVVDSGTQNIDLVLANMVSKSKWMCVQVLLQLHEKQMWIVNELSVDRNTLCLVAEGRWRQVGIMLTQDVSDVLRLWLTQTASSNARSTEFIKHILPHCADDQLDSVLTTLVERRLWWAVEEVLERGVSDSVKRWSVMEACQHYDESDSLDDVDEYIIEDILLHCADDQLDSVLTTLVERRQWRAIGEVLERDVSDSVKQWAVQEICKHYDKSDDYLTDNILSHCDDDQLDSVLTTLVERRQWRAVGEVLTLGISDSVKRWSVMEACQHGDEYASVDDVDKYITDNILPHCADDQLDSVLTTLVKQCLWRAVKEVFKRGVSDPVKTWAVLEVCQHCYVGDRYVAADTCILKDILPYVADGQLDAVLTTLVERRLCRSCALRQEFKRSVSDSVKQRVVFPTCEHYDESDNYGNADEYIVKYILSHCADDQLDSVLTTLVERRLWLSAQHVLERVAGDLKKEFAGQKACEHCRSAGAYFSMYRVLDSDSLVDNSFIPLCADGNLDYPASSLTKQDECTAKRNMSGREISDVQRRENITEAFRHADEDALIKRILPYYVYDSIHSALKMLASRGFWSAFVVLLHNSIIDTLYIWAVVKGTESKHEVFWDMVRNPCDGVKELTPAMWRSVNWSGLQRSLKQFLGWNTPLCEVLCESLLATVKEIWISGREKEIYIKENAVMEEALSTVEHLHQLVASFLVKCKTYHVSDLLLSVRREYAERRSKNCFLLQLYFTKNIVLQYFKRKAWKQMTDAILVVLTTVPIVPDVQSVALRVMLRHNRWDIVRHACLSGVCEQDRRQLFQAAVKKRQWSAVKRWADHTLYDDQRLWALGEARQWKRWDVYYKLADHGLSEWERVGVLFRVAMYADWKVVRRMLRTVADVTDMIDLLTNTPGASSKLGAEKYEQRMSDFNKFKTALMKVFEKTLKKVFEKTENKDAVTLKTLKTMAKQKKWWVVLHNIRHKPNLQHARRALKAAVSSEAWRAVMQLVRLETDVTRRDSLFRDMVRRRQWAVCRELLEQGVSHDLSSELLSEFIEHCQWTLVAMVMECTMEDKRRKNIMYLAIMKREGSVVWECINKLQTRLSVDERENLFQLAFNREVWQAVKPLVEEKDVTGIRHRDTALLEAIEQHQWDVVDHCQRHHADINMKDDDGHTPIHRAAWKEDWEAVKELTVRDGDPNLLDSGGLSVLHRAIISKQWDVVKLLIQFHGDIHQTAQYRQFTYYGDEHTPLQMLIEARQGEVIESSLMWCPDQQKVVNHKGETVLHAVCLSGWPGALYHLIARKVDPLAVTQYGHTALCYAVMCKGCPQRMVAECIELGFSTHQSHITHSARIGMTLRSDILTKKGERLLMSPLVLAVMRGLPVVTRMLCEAGEYSNSQLRELNVHLVELTKPNTDTGRTFRLAFSRDWRNVNLEYRDPDYSFDTELMEQSVDYLHQVCSTPRSLVSTCRLVISRCLTLSKTRHGDIAQLPLSSMMKNYLMFSDLTDPQYPDLSYRGKE